MATNRKLGRTTDIRNAMLKTLTTDLILKGKVETTEARAKEVKAIADSVIALAVKEYKNFEEVEVKVVKAKLDSKGRKVTEKVTSKNGKVYCYAFPFRGLKNIKTDGTFESSGSAADTYIGRLRFEKGGCAYSEICAIDAQNVGSQIYRVNGENTTKTKAEAFLKKQEKKKNVTWHQQNPISK